MPVTAHCYVVDAICDGDHGRKTTPRGQFTGTCKTHAFDNARHHGWRLDPKTRKALCPTCLKRASAPDGAA